MQIGIANAPVINGYGNLAALTNGIDWFAVINGVERILTPFGAIVDNEGLFRLGADNLQQLDFSPNDSILSFGDDITLFGDGFLLGPGDQMGVILRDDFTLMIKHEFQLKARGYQSVARGI